MTSPRDSLLQAIGVGPDNWDLLLVGDGSGNAWVKASGWCCIVMDRNVHPELETPDMVTIGAQSAGCSINVAEVLPYWFALHRHWNAGGKSAADKHWRVHIATDSEYAAKVIGGTQPMGGMDVAVLRGLFQPLAARGYALHWHHLPRETNPIHQYADRVAAAARESMYCFSEDMPELAVHLAGEPL